MFLNQKSLHLSKFNIGFLHIQCFHQSSGAAWCYSSFSKNIHIFTKINSNQDFNLTSAQLHLKNQYLREYWKDRKENVSLHRSSRRSLHRFSQRGMGKKNPSLKIQNNTEIADNTAFGKYPPTLFSTHMEKSIISQGVNNSPREWRKKKQKHFEPEPVILYYSQRKIWCLTLGLYFYPKTDCRTSVTAP